MSLHVLPGALAAAVIHPPSQPSPLPSEGALSRAAIINKYCVEHADRKVCPIGTGRNTLAPFREPESVGRVT